MKIQYYILFSFIVQLYSCNEIVKPNIEQKLGDVLTSHLDSTVHPGNDFFTYANGGWLAKNPIPASEKDWGIFNLVEDENYARLKKLSEDASAQQAKPGSSTQQIGDFFYTAMDSSLAEKLDITPIQPILKEIQSIKSIHEIPTAVMKLQQYGIEVGYNMHIGQDMMNSAKNRIYINQGGLGLPDRDYYFNTDTRTINIRTQYGKHITNMLSMLYNDSIVAKRMSNEIVQFESYLASKHKKLEALRDPYANYFKYATIKLNESLKAFEWKRTFEKFEIKEDSLIIGQPEFLIALQNTLQSTELSKWKSYLEWHTLSAFAPYLSSKYDKENFNFYNAILQGSKQQRPRWKRALEAQEDALGDALGQLYVKTFFTEKTKKRYETLVEHVVESYRERIQNLDWMSDSTKAKALVKLNAITRKVGYPTKWKDYSTMKIGRASYAENIMESKKWQFKYELSKLDKPVDKEEWEMTPQTYNAYYNPSNNEIVLPAAIFTAPGYKDEDIDDAVIYGYVGASTIGHELTHGFDDEGRQFDEKGNLNNWWSKADEHQFKQRADRLIQQFNEYVVLDSLHPNGKATLGENIADLGGIVIALDAFKKTTQFKNNKAIAGLTPLQRYFLGYAYGWMQTRRPETLANQLLTDVHAPIFLRVNGPMSNCDAWYQAFNVNSTHKLYRDSSSRVRIW